MLSIPFTCKELIFDGDFSLVWLLRPLKRGQITYLKVVARCIRIEIRYDLTSGILPFKE